MKTSLALLALTSFASASSSAERPPNVVIVFADDLGYADVGCFGSKLNATPHIDRLAKDGVRFTHFYVAQPVCSASRTALLTGCYPNRLGIHGALGPGAKHGIHERETTLAELCKSKGYATAAVGKWHLGHHPEFLPTRHGFDSYLGLPYSNDMWPNHPEAKKGAYPPLPLIDGEKVVNANVSAADQTQLTKQYTERAVKFINENAAKPFFLYVAHSMPHVPLHASAVGKSKNGLYGDVIEEIDGSVGAIVAALEAKGIAKNTLVIFTSDNGPWLSYGNHGGSAGLLREGKGTVWEGGVRVPFVAKWSEKIRAGTECSVPAMTIDLLPTVAKLIGADLPKLPIDGKEILPLLMAEKDAAFPHEALYFYYKTNELHAVRTRDWKLVLPHEYRSMEGQAPGKDGIPGKYKSVKLAKAELYNITRDPGEAKDVAAENPEIVRQHLDLAENARKDLGDSLTMRTGTGIREPGRIK